MQVGEVEEMTMMMVVAGVMVVGEVGVGVTVAGEVDAGVMIVREVDVVGISTTI